MNPSEFKQRRENLGISQSKLARMLEIDSMTVSRWERGIHPIPAHIRLALEALEMQLAKRREEAA